MLLRLSELSKIQEYGGGIAGTSLHLPPSALGRTDALDDAVESKATVSPYLFSVFSLLSSESVLCMGENATRNP